MRQNIFLPCLLFLGVIISFLPAKAYSQEGVFAVAGIEVDETADSAATARERAVAAGHRLALRRLVEKLVPASEWGGLSTFSIPLQDIYGLVSDFAVANEKTSDVRYLAEMSFRFHPDAVRDFLRRSNAPFAVTRSKPVLVVPVFGGAGDARLWENNPWYGIWAEYPRDRGLVPLLVPLGDLGDVASLDAAAALAGDSSRLRALADRYGAEEVLVAHAVLSDDASGGGRLDLTAFQLSSIDQGAFETHLGWSPEEAPEAVMARAVDKLDQQIQENWKEGNLLEVGEGRSIHVSVATPRLEDWLEVRRRLAAVATVETVRVLSLSTDTSELDIDFVGNEYQLTVALAQQDLHLALNLDSEWELGLAENAGLDGNLTGLSQ